jgi:hypothetical protein
MKNKISSTLALVILTFMATACGTSTTETNTNSTNSAKTNTDSTNITKTNISSFSFGTNDRAEPSSTTFESGDNVFAVANISKTGKYKVLFKVEKTSGGLKSDGEVSLPNGDRASLEVTDVPSGDYKAEVVLLDESGKEIDKKTGAFTVKSSD